VAVAPYHAVVIPVHPTDSTQMEMAENIYTQLMQAGVEVMLDDRNERPGVKFKDADLIGLPIRITVGKKAIEGIVEYKLRRSNELKELSVAEAIEAVKQEVSYGLKI